MEEREFNDCADEMLLRVERFLEGCVPVPDYDTGPGGVIEIEFEHGGGSKIIVNRHTAAREIWIAAKSGGFHFRPDAAVPGKWVATRGGIELLAQLSMCIFEQAGGAIRLPMQDA